jgi:hypothetical protein
MIKLTTLLFVFTLLSAAALAQAPTPAKPASDYFPLTPTTQYTYQGQYEDLRLGRTVKQRYVVLTKGVKRAGSDVIYFIEKDSETGRLIDLIEPMMIGLGAYALGPDGIYTYDCGWLKDIDSIPPKKPKLFLRNPITVGETVKITTDTGDSIRLYTVLGFEPVTVPAGHFDGALKIGLKTVSADGDAEQSFAWFAAGVGLVKWIRATGRVEELISKVEQGANLFPTIEPPDWKGVRFTFLPQQKMFQQYGYQSFHLPTDPRHSLPYAKYVGKVAVVTGVSTFQYGWIVTMAVEGTGEKIIAEVYTGTLNAVAPAQDVENARRLYKGKTLWTRHHLTTYNEELDQTGVASISHYVPVKVVDVVPGWEASEPVRFVVSTEAGFDGFIDVHMSDTNISDSLRQYNRFENIFLLSPP